MQTQNCIKCFQPLNGQTVCPHCGCNVGAYAPKDHYLPAGLQLHGRYSVGQALGEGGFGITYAGFDNQLRRRVAIKEFFPAANVWRETQKSLTVTCFNSQDQRESFENGKEKTLQEAQSLAQLDDIGAVVRVLDFFSENNTAYIIMEFVEGTTLKDFVKQLPVTMNMEQIMDLFVPVMKALQIMHTRGFVHRDISPDNIMVTTAQGQAKLLDFGAVKAVSKREGSSTEHPVIKRGFSPIELYSTTGLIGPWSDVYSLCATIYYLITGKLLQEPMDRLSSDNTAAVLSGKVSPQMEAVLEKGLAVRAEDRYQDMATLMKDMETAKKFSDTHQAATYAVPLDQTIPVSQSPYSSINDSMSTSGQVASPVYPVSGTDTSSYSSAQMPAAPATPENNKMKLLIGIGAGVIVLLLAVIIIMAVSKGKSSDGSDSQSTEEIAAVQEEETETEAATEAESTTKKKAVKNDVKMSDDLFDFTFELDGATYQLPCSIDCFLDNGWKFFEPNDLEETIPGSTSFSSLLVKSGDKKALIFFYNLSGNEKRAKDCLIGAIVCETRYNTNLTIAKGITTQSSLDEVTEAFGAPNDTSNGSDFTTVFYRMDPHIIQNFYLKMEIYNEDSTNREGSSIYLRNYQETELDVTETNDEVPEYLSEYKAPTALGNDLKSGIIKVDGDLYQLPCPIKAFIDNGWKITSHNGDVASGNTSSGVKISKDGNEIEIVLKNFASYQTKPENCTVCSVRVQSSNSIDFELPGGVKVGMNKDAVEKLVDSSFTYTQSESYVAYTYNEYTARDFEMSIVFNSVKMTVDRIFLECETWDY